MVKTLLLISLFVFAIGCGVRGRPTPPTTPPEIGRGQPTFRRATQQFAFPSVPPIPTPAPLVEEGKSR
jgi:hypothetical protein